MPQLILDEAIGAMSALSSFAFAAASSSEGVLRTPFAIDYT